MMEDSTLTQISNDLSSLDINSEETYPEFSWFNEIPKLTEKEINLNSANGAAYLDEDKNIISYRLMIQRVQQNNKFTSNLAKESQRHLGNGKDSLFSSFEQKQAASDDSTTSQDDDKASTQNKIDYDYWGKVISDYEKIIDEDPVRFHKQVTIGIPDKLRGIIWQTIVNSKCQKLETLYDSQLANKESPKFEKQIKKDLARTRFVSSSSVVSDKSESLYNIMKAYSLFDQAVGYTQGMAFFVTPLLINLSSESETFSLLVNLMQVYSFRDLYLPDMPRLHLLLYQFERLLEDKCPKLFNHLNKQGIKSSMYASQWFLTMFSYKFPLDIVIRIYDIIMIEGIEATLKFATLLMLKNESKLITLSFDQLIDYLKDNLFDYYLCNDTADEGSSTYKINELVSDAMKIKLIPSILHKYQLEYESIHKLERQRDHELESLRSLNSELVQQIKDLESNYETLNKSNVEITNEMIQKKVNLANLDDENIELKDEIAQLNEKLTQLKEDQLDFAILKEYYDDDNSIIKELQSDSVTPSFDFESELNKTMEQNLEIMETNRMLEEQLSILDKQYRDNKTELDKVKDAYEHFAKKYNIPVEQDNEPASTSI